MALNEKPRGIALMIQGVNKNQNTITRAQKELSRISMNLQEILPNLNESQARGLSELVSAILHTGSCSRTKRAYFLADRLASEIEAVRKRLARWVLGTTKEKQHEIDVSQFVTSLMAWIVSKWPSKQMALAIDMTHLSDKWIVMVVTVLYGQFGIPVNWRVFRASEKFHAREIWPSMWSALAAVRSGRQMKPYPPTPLPSTEHWLPTEHHLRALVSLGVDLIRASTDPLLDLLAERFSPPRWHVGSGTLQKTKGHVPL